MRKNLCIVLVFIIVSFSIFSKEIFAEEKEQNTNSSNSSVKDLKTEQEQLQQKIDNANDELNDIQDELSQNLQQVQKLDEKILTSQSELDELNTKIIKLQASISKVEGELKIAEEKYNRQKELLEERLVLIYESGDTRYLDVMLSSTSVSDFLSNYFLITELTSYETDLLEDVKAKKDRIELSKQKLDKDKEQLGIIKQNQTKTAKVLENTRIVRENYISKLSEQEKETQAKIDEYNKRFEEINREILALAREGMETQYIGGELAWPVPGYTRISSKYGMRTHPITGVYKLHTGVDISAPMGANFIAANDGIVTKAGMNSAYGNMVIIDHGGGISTLYAHGSEILVKVGQTVKRGEQVLKVGSTGYSTGPHAHFEVRINGVVTDPMPYITSGVIPNNSDTDEKNENSKTNNTTNSNNTVENSVKK